jgi:ribosome-associated toxin RatA of RatAB toxin-antitoxin module
VDLFQIVEEFNWVNKVLFSSQTDRHIQGSINVFNNFMNKWRFEMTQDLKITLSNDFYINFEEQSKKIEKNGVIM